MTKREALANKILVLGIDGLDPRLTRKYVDEGVMPNTKKFIERGASRAGSDDAGRAADYYAARCGRHWPPVPIQ